MSLFCLTQQAAAKRMGLKQANGSADLLPDLFLGLCSNDPGVDLAGQDSTIYFTKTHIADLKAVVGMDDSKSDEDE